MGVTHFFCDLSRVLTKNKANVIIFMYGKDTRNSKGNKQNISKRIYAFKINGAL